MTTKSFAGPYYMPQDAIGVLGTPVPDRTSNDQRLQAEFNREKFVQFQDFGPRTQKDLMMQAVYNPLVKEGYAYGNNMTSKVSDNPNNPYSKYASYVALG